MDAPLLLDAAAEKPNTAAAMDEIAQYVVVVFVGYTIHRIIGC